MSSKNNRLITYPSETVVYSEANERVVSCPTEDEAVEYIRDKDNEKEE